MDNTIWYAQLYSNCYLQPTSFFFVQILILTISLYYNIYVIKCNLYANFNIKKEFPWKQSMHDTKITWVHKKTFNLYVPSHMHPLKTNSMTCKFKISLDEQMAQEHCIHQNKSQLEVCESLSSLSHVLSLPFPASAPLL